MSPQEVIQYIYDKHPHFIQTENEALWYLFLNPLNEFKWDEKGDVAFRNPSVLLIECEGKNSHDDQVSSPNYSMPKQKQSSEIYENISRQIRFTTGGSGSWVPKVIKTWDGCLLKSLPQKTTDEWDKVVAHCRNIFTLI